MSKAYSLKLLVSKLKEKGLDVTEDMAIVLVEVLFDWAQESAKVSSTKIDDFVALFYPKVKKLILEDLVDQIDGKDDVVVEDEEK